MGAPRFTLSASNGIKTVYFKVKNANGESPVVSDTITLKKTNGERLLLMQELTSWHGGAV